MDIVERLRELSTEERRKHKSPPDLVMFDAADEIERLRQLNAELVEALQCLLKYPNVQKYVGNELYENAAAAIAKSNRR